MLTIYEITSIHKHNPVENTPVYSAGIQGKVTIQCQTIVHVQDDGSQAWMPSEQPPTKYHIVEQRATTHT